MTMGPKDRLYLMSWVRHKIDKLDLRVDGLR